MSYRKKQIKQLITWVLLALLLWVWVQFIVFPKHQQHDIKAVTAPPSQQTDMAIRPKPSSFHLFGSSTETEIPLELLQAESSLDLIITGIIASNDPQLGRAYIRNQGEEKKFRVGDDVFGLATLDAIHDDYLVLRRGGGKQEKLSLSKGRQINTNRTNNTTQNNVNQAASTTRIANHIKKSSDWQDVLNQQKYDPNKIANMASKVSVIRDSQGQIAGLRVSQLAGADSLVKQGLRANDQIVAVNGVKISYQNMLTLQQQLTSSDQASVTVMRNGKQMNLNLNLSEFQQ